MSTLHVRRQDGSNYTVIRRENDQTPGFTTIASFSASEAVVETIMNSRDYRLAILHVFEGPYHTGQRPLTMPIINEVIDPVVPAVIDAALQAHRQHTN